MHKDHVEGKSHSSYAIVRAELTAGHEGPAAKIRILQPQNCDHTETVCQECLSVWEYDWTFSFHRTVGGRRLAELAGRTL